MVAGSGILESISYAFDVQRLGCYLGSSVDRLKVR